MLTVGSLFAGIGGFDLGLERTGHMRTVWFCEQDPYCQRVLAKHWPGVPIHDDVRALVADPRSVRGATAAERQHHTATHGDREDTEPVGASTSDSGGDRRSMPVPVPYVDILTGG